MSLFCIIDVSHVILSIVSHCQGLWHICLYRSGELCFEPNPNQRAPWSDAAPWHTPHLQACNRILRSMCFRHINILHSLGQPLCCRTPSD